MQTVVLVLHIFAAVGIVVLVLLQHGKGADMGAAFGGGSSGSVFGSAGSANFLSRTTGILAFLFFVSSVALTVFGSMHARSSGGGLMDRVGVPTAPAVPGSTLPGAVAPAKAGDPAPAGTGSGTGPAPAPANVPANGTTGNPVTGAAGAANVPGTVTPAKSETGAPSKSSEVPK